MVKVQLGATIPTAQYSNLQPLIEVEADSVPAGLDEALGHIKQFWDRVGTKPLEIDRQAPATPAANGVMLECRVSGTRILFDPVAHTYHDKEGRRYMGGSTFANKFKQGFPAERISEQMAAKHGVEAADIRAMWQLNAEASSTFGTSVHAALQLYGTYLELSKKVKDGSEESALTKNPTLQPIVLKFFTDERKSETAFYEEFTANSQELSCGLIDRLVVDDDGGLWIEDFKSNTAIDKEEKVLAPFKGVVPDTSIGIYWLQLSYYGRILMAHGRKVKGLRIHHWTGQEWVTYEHEVVDLSPAFKES